MGICASAIEFRVERGNNSLISRQDRMARSPDTITFGATYLLGSSAWLRAELTLSSQILRGLPASRTKNPPTTWWIKG